MDGAPRRARRPQVPECSRRVRRTQRSAGDLRMSGMRARDAILVAGHADALTRSPDRTPLTSACRSRCMQDSGDISGSGSIEPCPRWHLDGTRSVQNLTCDLGRAVSSRWQTSDAQTARLWDGATEDGRAEEQRYIQSPAEPYRVIRMAYARRRRMELRVIAFCAKV